MSANKGDIAAVSGWTVKVLGHSKDGRVVFERIPSDGKRYACEPQHCHVQTLHEDLDDNVSD